MVHKYLLIPVTFLVPVFIINTKCHTPNNNSDVIITYSNHDEADLSQIILTQPELTTTDNVSIKNPEEKKVFDTTTEYVKIEEATDVFFIPNDKSVERTVYKKGVDINDFLTKKTINDVVNGPNIKLETESPPANDIIFVSGKNNEIVENLKSEKQDDTRRKEKGTAKKAKKLKCTNLECENDVEAVCGGKKDNSKWRYRLFLNDCYFRKVNCGFKYENNRYIVVNMTNCKTVGSHDIEKAFSFKAIPAFVPKPEKINITRRSTSSRRSLSSGINGQYCSHPCPVVCPEDYFPECGVSRSGQRKVFVNHCQMDYNSCLHGVEWQKRPLSECVGVKKADLNQNKDFIGWMRRSGIIDKRGRLVVS